MSKRKPTSAEISAALGKTVPDIIAPNLNVLFCGINPSLYSAAVGHHFARPGNRFWRSLYAAGFTERLLAPFEDRDLLKFGYGLTNIVDRATARADELDSDELVTGRQQLVAKVQYYQPRCLAILGISAYRTAFNSPKAVIGKQHNLDSAIIWVLPNPSGLMPIINLMILNGCMGNYLLRWGSRGAIASLSASCLSRLNAIM